MANVLSMSSIELATPFAATVQRRVEASLFELSRNKEHHEFVPLPADLTLLT